MNLFGTVLTYPSPSANYRGESEENRAILQKITRGRFEYAVISPEAMRNALRETLRHYGLPCNRERLHNEEQLAVRFADYPWPETYVDDFYFGYLVADRKQIPAEIVKSRAFQFKRDSVLRMNLAVALEPFRHDSLFTQSPLSRNQDLKWQNATTSALLHRETSYTPFQYPFALNLNDCQLGRGEQYKNWLRHLLRGISELNGVSGNHARSYFEMAPASLLLRRTPQLVAGYSTYAFTAEGGLPEVVDAILHEDLPGAEFFLGGLITKKVLSEKDCKGLQAKGVKLFRTSAQALNAVACEVTGAGFLAAVGSSSE